MQEWSFFLKWIQQFHKHFEISKRASFAIVYIWLSGRFQAADHRRRKNLYLPTRCAQKINPL